MSGRFGGLGYGVRALGYMVPGCRLQASLRDAGATDGLVGQAFYQPHPTSHHMVVHAENPKKARRFRSKFLSRSP